MARFYTQKKADGWYGFCREDASVSVGPRRTQDMAYNAVKRLVEKGSGQASKPMSTTPAATTSTRKVNHFAFVVDRSGSMQTIWWRAVQALRSNIQTLVEQARTTGQETRVTIISFDDRIETVVQNKNVMDLGAIADSHFTPRNQTALLDATGCAINTLKGYSIESGVDVAYVTITITDGYENASVRFTAETLKKLMQEVQGTDRWTLTFLVPPGNKHSLVSSFDIPSGNVQEWEQTEKGVSQYEVSASVGTQAFYAARTLGATKSKTFFTTDLSKVKAEDLKNLTNVRAKVRMWTVEKEGNIRTFCEYKTGKPYVRGAAFYALTKRETVQPYKQIVIAEKGKGGAVYAGADARKLLGLPSNEDVKVVPGNHANYDVYVQSTSTNRVLVRGTKVIYYEDVAAAAAAAATAAGQYVAQAQVV